MRVQFSKMLGNCRIFYPPFRDRQMCANILKALRRSALTSLRTLFNLNFPNLHGPMTFAAAILCTLPVYLDNNNSRPLKINVKLCFSNIMYPRLSREMRGYQTN